MADITSTTRSALLAIDTSTERAGLAVTDGTHVAELAWHAGRDQTVSVLEQIDHLLRLAGIEIEQVGAIAVATGPGMFNGLRVGMSVAKGLHLAIGAHLIGISTLTVTAEPFLDMAPEVFAVVAAGRGRLVWQCFPGDDIAINGTAEELARTLSTSSGEPLIAGDLTVAQSAVLQAARPGAVVPALLRARRAAVLAELGWRRFLAGDIDDPVTLAPAYVHASQSLVSG